jgi:DNA-binding NtrC family response regulator
VARSLAENRRIMVLAERPHEDGGLADCVALAGYQVAEVTARDDALGLVRRSHHDAVILDLDPGTEVEQVRRLLHKLRRASPGTALLVMADAGRVREAAAFLRDGADDYVLRPPDGVELHNRLGRILDRHELDSRLTLLQEELAKKRYGVKRPVGRSQAMRQVLSRVARVAPMRTTVLICGESGVGKELVARAIHFNSPRRDQAFIALNCAAIPSSLIESELFGHERGSFTGAHTRARGKFELADRGTLFLDEISEMNLSTQAKLLRILEEREFMRVGGDHSVRVDVRVIAATNADLEGMVARSGFRRDLYYRLKVVTIQVPPLRERQSDIPFLVEAFLEELSRINAVPRKTITPEALEALSAYAWPGNVRELKNLLESLLVSVPGEVVRVQDLPSPIQGAELAAPESMPGMTLAEMERELIRRTLGHTGGNRTHSALLLGIGVRTLQRKIRTYSIEIPSTRRRPRGATER